MCARRRQQRGLVAAALLTGLHEYQQRRTAARALPSSTTNSRGGLPHSNSFQEPMIQGVTYMAPRYVEPVDPNPPAYEEATGQTPTTPQQPSHTLVDEKRQLYRLSTEEQIPPHVHANYQPNTGLDAFPRSSPVEPINVPRIITPVDSIPRSIPAPAVVTPYSPLSTTSSRHHSDYHGSKKSQEILTHLKESISLYYDTQIKLNADKPSKARHLESKKERKLAKAEKKYHEHMAKGKDSKSEAKMEKRAEKMEKWTEWVLKKSIERDEKGHHRHEGRKRKGSKGSIERPVHTTTVA